MNLERCVIQSKEFEPISRDNLRVLTTAQLAESFGTDSKIINRNFQRNTEKYTLGKHYFALSGEELKAFKASRQNDASLKYASILYLWTEKGAWLHAKSLNTEKAWDAYQLLIDDYYRIKDETTPTKVPTLSTVFNATAALIEENQVIKQEQEELRKLVTQLDYQLKNEITLNYGEQRRLQKGISAKVYEICNDPNKRPKYFAAIYRDIKDRFGVSSYKDVKRHELLVAIRFIENWSPKRVS